ncbi:14854_t:CDS:2 [Acaulospora morrowiae]|uniref:14854_t:CDS:1 n=1 Tax=Acaulospora morrowiae TaxID=94023 RepID=A0A9N9AMM4_9GLOM|nr:14854_t:CDS:2 [Acaulospora morrowiae]
MRESDLERFDWNLKCYEKNDIEEETEGVCYDFEVKKSQEQEDFEILPGFQVRLPQQIISDIQNGYPLQPIVVESVTSPTLITQNKITVASEKIQNTLNTEKLKFKEDFGKILDGYALRIDKNLSIENLETLIKNGLPEMEEELLGPYRKALECKKAQDKSYRKQVIEEGFSRICKRIENKFNNGPILRIIDLREGDYYFLSGRVKYSISYEIEIIYPDQLKITIYQTSIDEMDKFLLPEIEYYIPTPEFNQYQQTIGYSFQINLETHEIRNFSQFGNKFFLALWNNKENRLEIYFDTASGLSLSFQCDSPKFFRTLYPEKNTLIAVNESRGLIGFYCIDSGSLVQWYNYMVPEIQHFFFIKDTEDICFIEKNGRSRIYIIVSNQFRPGSLQLPSNFFKVLSTPDGACIIAFTKDTVYEQDEERNDLNDADSSIEESDLFIGPNDHNPEDQTEMVRMHVFFCAKFGSTAIIPMPKNIQSSEHFQFSFIEKLQMHLTYLDLENGLFCSQIITVTPEETQYRLQQRSYKILAKRNTNSFVNVYRYMFEKYSVDHYIEPNENRSLNLSIILEMSDYNIEDYKKRFKYYINDMLKGLEKSTKKPTGSLKNFGIGNL